MLNIIVHNDKKKEIRNYNKNKFYHFMDGAYIRYIRFVGIILINLFVISSAAALDTVHTNIFFDGKCLTIY